MKINLQPAYQEIKSQYSGLNFFQWEKYWLWYLELNAHAYPYYSQAEIFDIWMKKNRQGIPLAYILGQWAFYQDYFFVDLHVLIPRPETELMVEMALKKINQPMNVLEIGVGSGALTLSLLLHSPFPLNFVTTDISPEALRCAKRNYSAKKHRMHLEHQLNFELTDRTKNLPKNTFDLIVSNPPYIPHDSPTVSMQVKKHEPALALFLKKENYFEWMMELIAGIGDCLKIGGSALIEGHEDFLGDIKTRAEKELSKQFSYILHHDLNKLPRFLEVNKN